MKFRTAFKQKVVDYYLSGNYSYREVSKKFDVSPSVILEWVKRYQANGKDGLRKKKYNSYSSDFKKNILHFINTTGASDIDTATKFSLSSSGLIRDWRQDSLRNEGILPPEPKEMPILTRLKASKNNEELTREQSLERESEKMIY